MKAFEPKPDKHSSAEDKGNGSYLINLQWAELEYDVKYALFRRGRSLSSASDAAPDTALTDDDKDFLLRSFSCAVEEAKEALSAYATDRSRMVSDELLEAPMDYDIPLHFDAGWLGHASVLASRVHSYVVRKTVGSLLQMMGDSYADSYEMLAARDLRLLKAEANKYDVESTLFIL